MNNTKILLIIPIILILLTPLAASAFIVKTDRSVYVAPDETIDGNLYAIASTITIDGLVEGDVICGGQTVIINGMVNGDVICGAGSIQLNGTVNGSVRVAAANSVTLNSTTTRNVQAFGASIILSPKATVGMDFFVLADVVEIRGDIMGDLHGEANKLNVSGSVGKDLKMRLNENANKSFNQRQSIPLTISDTAVISGNVYYTSAIEGRISKNADIGGEVGHSFTKKGGRESFIEFWAWGKLFSIFSSLVIGLVLVSLWRRPLKNLTDLMIDKMGASIGWGLIILVLTPVIAVLLIMTIIGIPLAGILIGVWLIAIYLSKIIVGILIGRSLSEKISPKKSPSLIWSMVIGIVLLSALTSLPGIGWMLTLVAVWWGLGGIWLTFKKA